MWQVTLDAVAHVRVRVGYDDAILLQETIIIQLLRECCVPALEEHGIALTRILETLELAAKILAVLPLVLTSK